MGYAQIPLWLSQDELAELIGQVRDALLAKRDEFCGSDCCPTGAAVRTAGLYRA